MVPAGVDLTWTRIELTLVAVEMRRTLTRIIASGVIRVHASGIVLAGMKCSTDGQ